jgi:hypothetical protein
MNARRFTADSSRAFNRKDSTPQLRQETAALRDFNPRYDRSGSKAAETISASLRPMSALPPKADILALSERRHRGLAHLSVPARL